MNPGVVLLRSCILFYSRSTRSLVDELREGGAMSADAPKKRVIEANDYVAEGDRGKASAAWENGH